MKIFELFLTVFSMFGAAAVLFGALFWVGIIYLIIHLTKKDVNNNNYQCPLNQYPPNQYPPNQYPRAIPIARKEVKKKIYKIKDEK